MRKLTMSQEEIIYLGSIELYGDMKEEAPEWLEHLGIESSEDISQRWREGTWVMPDYKRAAPPE